MKLSSQWGMPNRLLTAAKGRGRSPSSVMTIRDFVPQRYVAFNVVTTARNPPPSRKNSSGILSMKEPAMSAREVSRVPLHGAIPAATRPMAT
jgi:hypothetical protein